MIIGIKFFQAKVRADFGFGHYYAAVSWFAAESA